MGHLVDMEQITSRFDGVIKKLYHEPEDMAQVGKVNPKASHAAVEAVLKCPSPSVISTS